MTVKAEAPKKARTRSAPLQRATVAPADKTREKLLAAALLLFGDNGFHGTSLRDIANAAKTNVALVSYHFGGKEQLYHELLRTLVTKNAKTSLARLPTSLADAIQKQTLTPNEARTALKTLLHGFITNTLANHDILLFARIMVREQTRPTAGFDIVYKSGMERFHTLITHLFALASGRAPSAQEAIIRAHMLIGQMFSFVFANAAICRRLGKKRIDPDTRETIARILEENIDTLCTATKA